MSGQNERKPFPLRLEPATLAALKAWAAEDLRSLNGQIEYLLRAALRDAGRLPARSRRDRPDADAEPDRATLPGARDQTASGPAAGREPVGSAKVMG
jgi:hypothetical protein